jgi:hypothetical protein
MESNKSRFDIWMCRLKKGLEILAIPVAAWWAFTRFSEGEKPSLEYRAAVEGELKWYKHSSGDCLAEYKVSLKNIGKTSFDLTKANLRAWTFDDIGPFKGVRYINPRQLVEGKTPIVNEEIKDDLIGHYAPDVGDVVGFNFGVERKRGAMILFLFQAESSQKRELSPWEDYRLDYVCDEPPEGAKAKPAH